jgi:hypothetical protein
MSIASNDNRACVTCDLWGGPRQANAPYPSVIVTFDYFARGKCFGGGFQNTETAARASCGQWKKWGPLK